MTNLTKCAVCDIAATQKCGGCKNVVYCGKEHQKIHWKKGHKAACKCYEVATNELLGRHMRATRDIKQGEIILREAPLIYGPKTASAPICLGCHRLLSAPEPPQSNYYKCRKCGWPLCSANCETASVHITECELMAGRHFNAKIDYNPANERAHKKESAYCVILPLRCLLLQQNDPVQYARFAALEDHLAERLDTPLYKVLRANLITFCKTILGLNDAQWTEEDILRVAARLDTNAFELRQSTYKRKLRAIYANAAMISHDCVSNARHTFDEQMHIVFIAKRHIAKGDIIATSYTQPLKSTLMRRAHLSLAKCFDCTCQRCRDASELDLFVGAIICSKCRIGKIVSTLPLDNAAMWQCQLCGHEINAKQINWGNQAMQKEIDVLDRTSPRQFEEFLHRYRDTLHETNTHVLQVKYALTQLYGNVPGFYLNEINDAAVKRKIQLCQELLEVADVLDGGCSIFRGNLLLDLQEAQAVLVKREFLAGLLTREATQERLTECMDLLKEAIEIMKLEPNMQTILQERTAQLARELEIN